MSPIRLAKKKKRFCNRLFWHVIIELSSITAKSINWNHHQLALHIEITNLYIPQTQNPLLEIYPTEIPVSVWNAIWTRILITAWFVIARDWESFFCPEAKYVMVYLKQWFSKCGTQTVTLASPRNLIEMQIFRPHPRPLE